MNRRAVLRELARDNVARPLAAFYPLAISTQFLGSRSALEITISMVFIAVSLVMVTRALYRSAAYRVEDQVLAAEHAKWTREHVLGRADKHVA